MDLNLVLFFFLLLSDGVLQVMGGGSMARRSLLQAKKDCRVSFEHQNYTSITSKCKSPYLPNLCCPPFTDFVCNFSQYLNDGSNNCAETMFSYLLNLIGSYPPGLFSSVCRGDKEGLPCNVSSSTDQTSNGRSAQGDISEMYSLVMALTVSGLGMLLFY